jgi:hypothetical protein
VSVGVKVGVSVGVDVGVSVGVAVGGGVHDWLSLETKTSLLPALVRLKVPAPGSKSTVPAKRPVV